MATVRETELLLSEMEREVIAPVHLKTIREILALPEWDVRLLMNILIREVKAGLRAEHLGAEDEPEDDE